MIKAVFFDVDGTIVPFDKHVITDTTLESLYALQRNGVKVVVASGRPIYMIDNVRDFPFDAWIGCNGAHANIGGETVCSVPVNRDSMIKMAEVAVENDIPAFLFGPEAGGVSMMNADSTEIQNKLRIPMPEFCDIVEMAKSQPIYEATIYVTKDLEEKLLHPVLSDVEYIRWHPLFTDVNPKGLSKATAMKAVLDHFGFDISESMAFGDGGNDVPMIAASGIGVAMGNASEEVKRHADYVTLDVDNDGVTAALKHFSLI